MKLDENETDVILYVREIIRKTFVLVSADGSAEKVSGEGEGGNQCPSLATLFNSAYPFISDVGIAKGRRLHSDSRRCQMS